MVRRVPTIAVVLACAGFAACQSGPGAASRAAAVPEAGAADGGPPFVSVASRPSAEAPTVRPASVAPTQAYAEIARLVHRCWLNPREPLLVDHDFRAEASPGGGARILLSERARGGSLRAYSIDFESRFGGADIRARNHRLPEELARKFDADVGRWSAGDLTCQFEN